MKELVAVFDDYLERYDLNVVSAARIAILAVGMLMALFARGKAQRVVLFTALLAFTLTFLPEIVSLCRVLVEDSKKY